MIGLRFGSGVICIGAAVALLSGCGGPGGIAGTAVPQRVALAANQMKSNTSPSCPSTRNLLYITGDYQSMKTWIYTYAPGTIELCGSLPTYGLTGPIGPCSDSAGNVYIPTKFASKGEVVEYAHAGTTIIKTLTGLTYPEDCAVDSTTGDLAVTEESAGIVEIFKGAKKGTPQQHVFGVSGFQSEVVNATYDSSGDLFVDASLNPDKGGPPKMAVGELKAPITSSSKFTFFSYPEGSKATGFPGGIQWDGQHVAVGDETTCNVYILGSSGSTTSTITLPKCNGVQQFWISTDRLIGSNTNAYSSPNVMLWAYPTPGKGPKKTLRGLQGASGVTISVAK
jgi:hypothetical protein